MKTKQLTFKAKEGSRISDEKADEYGRHILKLTNGSKFNSITAKELLEDAKNTNAPYHDYFNWDNTLAAENFRLMQARQLLGSIVEIKIVRQEEVPVRVFVNVYNEDGEKSYVPTSYAMSTPILANQVVANALKEVKSWSNKYKEYQELSKIRIAIEKTELDLES